MLLARLQKCMYLLMQNDLESFLIKYSQMLWVYLVPLCGVLLHT